MRPRERIIELLKSYPYACTPESASGPTGRSRWHSVAHRFDDLWYQGSYAELARCLARMRREERETYWHVTRRYVVCDVLPMDVPVRRSRWGAKPILAPYCELAGGLPGPTGRTCRVLVRRWDHKVREPLVLEGLAWLQAEMFGGQSDRITLPAVLLAELAA